SGCKKAAREADARARKVPCEHISKPYPSTARPRSFGFVARPAGRRLARPGRPDYKVGRAPDGLMSIGSKDEPDGCTRLEFAQERRLVSGVRTTDADRLRASAG